MKELAVSNQAQVALAKLLGKLELICPDRVPAEWDLASCPIKHFAEAKLFKEEEAIRRVHQALQIPAIVFDAAVVGKLLDLLDNDAVKKISPPRWRSLRALPVQIGKDAILLAMANPLDQEQISALSFELNCKIEAALAREGDILEILARKENSRSSLFIDNLLPEAKPQEAAPTLQELQQLDTSHLNGEVDLDAAPVVRLVNAVFSEAVARQASDVHFNPEKDGLTVRLRLDGVMRDVLNVPTNFRNGMVSRIKLLCGMDIAERRRPQDGRLRLKTAQGVKDLRVSSVPTLYGENLVCRILSADASHISFDALGMPPEVEANLCRSLRQTSRVILVTGPTGSGKTSTLYAALRYLNDGTKNIITIEDPIEYRIAGLQQIQVNPKINFSFAEGLRSVLRQDPDIIMLGEIRDEETAQIAIQAAQTGHLVLATLHTNSAASAVQRLIDLKVPPFSVASALSTVLAQRLVRRLCPHCAQPVDPQHYAQLAALGLTLAQLHEPAGCSHCEQSGYIGRLAIYSLLEINDALRGAIRNQTSEMELEQLALGNGYQSLGQAAAELLEQGITSLAEIESKLGPIDSLLATGQPLNGQPAPQSGVSKHRVLLVEDDETTRYILAMLLRDQMYEVEEAADGKEALEAVYRQPPTLIVSDVMMPKLGGVELVKMLRNDKRTCNIPILMLTALDSEEKELQLIENGADDFVGKTADTRLFLARVQRLLQRSSEGA